MHKLVYRYWNLNLGQWSFKSVIGTMEEIEEFLTHTKIEIVKPFIDGVPYHA